MKVKTEIGRVCCKAILSNCRSAAPYFMSKSGKSSACREKRVCSRRGVSFWSSELCSYKELSGTECKEMLPGSTIRYVTPSCSSSCWLFPATKVFFSCCFIVFTNLLYSIARAVTIRSSLVLFFKVLATAPQQITGWIFFIQFTVMRKIVDNESLAGILYDL